MSLRKSSAALAAVCAVATLLAGCGTAAAPGPAGGPDSDGTSSFQLVRVASGLDRPTYVAAAPGDPEALWVLEQPGRVVRLQGDDRSLALDLSDSVRTGAEQGLLGLAFHPRFATNRRLFLHWSDLAGDTRVVEFRATPDGRSIEPGPVAELLFVDQPEENHNGGQLAFGPDGRLYLGLGDGGGAFDSEGRAQDPNQLLGKVIATDVDSGTPQWDVVVTGLRNPWRFSFDPALGELWVADVGQDEFEEVNRLLLETDEPPKNLGWSAFEGTKRLEGNELAGPGEVIWPVATYTHDEGCSVIGGFVYGGAAVPDLVRRYVFGDFCSGTLWSLTGTPEGGITDMRRETEKVPQLTSISQDGDGEMVFSSATGSIFRAVPAG